jgi:hypothetical protein
VVRRREPRDEPCFTSLLSGTDYKHIFSTAKNKTQRHEYRRWVVIKTSAESWIVSLYAHHLAIYDTPQ